MGPAGSRRRKPPLFSQLLAEFVAAAELEEGLFFMCDTGDMLAVAQCLDCIPAAVLPLHDRYTFCLAPVMDAVN